MAGHVHEKDSHAAGMKTDSSAENVFLVLCFAMTVVIASMLYTYSVRKEARTGLDETREELAAHEKAVATMSAESDSPERREEVAQAVREKIAGEIKNLQASVEGLRTEGRSVEELGRKVDSLAASFAQHEAEGPVAHDALGKRIDDLAAKTEAARTAGQAETDKKVEAGQKATAAQVAEVQKALSTLQSGQNGFNAKLGEMNGKIDAVKNNGLDQRLDALEKKIAALEALEKKVGALETATTENAATGKATAEGLTQSAQISKTLADQIDKLTQRVEALEKKK